MSLFAGCGGSSLGYSAAGYRELLAAEWDAKAVRVFRANFPGVPVHQGDITRLDPAALDLAPGALGLLDSSPPCVAYSMTGLRRMSDPRGQLWTQVTRLAAAWRPRLIVLENVPGLVRGAMREIFRDICAALAAIGYRVEARLLDSSYLGVPQRRVRVFVVAVRCDLGAAQVFPVPRTRPLTVREAWEGLVPSGSR